MQKLTFFDISDFWDYKNDTKWSDEEAKEYFARENCNTVSLSVLRSGNVAGLNVQVLKMVT